MALTTVAYAATASPSSGRPARLADLLRGDRRLIENTSPQTGYTTVVPQVRGGGGTRIRTDTIGTHP